MFSEINQSQIDKHFIITLRWGISSIQICTNRNQSDHQRIKRGSHGFLMGIDF
jgi:hypothetical protein